MTVHHILLIVFCQPVFCCVHCVFILLRHVHQPEPLQCSHLKYLNNYASPPSQRLFIPLSAHFCLGKLILTY